MVNTVVTVVGCSKGRLARGGGSKGGAKMAHIRVYHEVLEVCPKGKRRSHVPVDATYWYAEHEGVGDPDHAVRGQKGGRILLQKYDICTGIHPTGSASC